MPLEAPDQVFFAPHNQMRLQQLVEFFFDKLPSGALLGKNYWTATSMCWTASLTTVTRLIICDKCHGVHECAPPTPPSITISFSAPPPLLLSHKSSLLTTDGRRATSASATASTSSPRWAWDAAASYVAPAWHRLPSTGSAAPATRTPARASRRRRPAWQPPARAPRPPPPREPRWSPSVEMREHVRRMPRYEADGPERACRLVAGDERPGTTNGLYGCCTSS